MKDICPDQVAYFNSSEVLSPSEYHQSIFLFVIEFGYLFVVMVVAASVNILVMIAILRIPMLRRNKNNILVLNLIIMDLCTTLGSMPFALADLFWTGYFICHQLLCRVSIKLLQFISYVEQCTQSLCYCVRGWVCALACTCFVSY